MERKIITNISEIQNPDSLGKQVSSMIAEYNKTHPYEMLPKTPEVVVEHLANGLSVVVADCPNGVDQRLLFHASLYANFEQGEENILGVQVVELGSWIVPEYARGEGNGTHGVNALLRLAESRWNPVLMLSTHKRMAALKVSGHNGLRTADYRDFPYLSYLTCSCSNCSEREGHRTCVFRRLTPDVVEIGEGGKIACTLVVSDIQKASEFEERCREIHSEFAEPISPGEITIATMARAHVFFEGLKK